MAHNNVTLRKQLLAELHDFCKKSQVCPNQIIELVITLVPLLAHYTEEGVALRPCVYLVSDWNGFIKENALQLSVPIGTTPPTSDGIQHVLKKTAPLAADNWSILVSVSNSLLSFGIFSEGTDPRSISIRSVLAKGSETEVKCIRLRQVSDGTVNLLASNGESITIRFTSETEQSVSPEQHLEKLADAITQQVQAEQEAVRSYIYRIIGDAIDACHGTLIAVTSGETIPAGLKDSGIFLEPPIDLASRVQEFTNGSAQLGELHAYSSLVKGMTNSDGILVLSNSGKILGFNVFVQPDNATKTSGGARSKAFAGLTAMVGKGIQFVFKRSQDGQTDVAHV